MKSDSSDIHQRILLIEDENTIGEGLKFNLELEGYHVDWIQDGAEASRALKESEFLQKWDAVVLDLMLPKMSGFDLLKQVREQSSSLPVLVLSARSLEVDKVTALREGADDYVTKPFSLQELLLRLNRLIRTRIQDNTNSGLYKDQVKIGEALYFPQQHILKTYDNRSVPLSSIESQLLMTFLDYSNMVLSRTDLLEKVWKTHGELETRTVDVFVAKVRKLIEKDPSEPQHILSVRGVGYCYVTDKKLREDLRSPKKQGPN